MLKPLLALSLFAACSTTTAAAPSAQPAQPTQTAGSAEPDAVTVAELAAKRAQMIGWLHDYREAGAFPTDGNGDPASVFKDQNGVRCPMAELLHKAGRDDLVDEVVKEANGVRLSDVHAGPLHGWMLASGLTEQEIAMVQGAMNISNDWMPPEQHSILAGQAAVRAKLEIAEIALRDNTRHALEDAAHRLGPDKIAALAAMPVRGPVLSPAAIEAAGAAENAALRAQVQVRRRYPYAYLR